MGAAGGVGIGIASPENYVRPLAPSALDVLSKEDKRTKVLNEDYSAHTGEAPTLPELALEAVTSIFTPTSPINTLPFFSWETSSSHAHLQLGTLAGKLRSAF